ncbi:MAG: pyridoxal phosphate-dependent aminotransferase family protein [Campylobacterales bacterium]|nr:pyridoxal phosphate-dependent aminotransferase family protein [Campylobacterales bacterium]
MYQKELDALQKAGRFRERKIYNDNLIDFASNDYLGLANNKEQLQKALELLNNYDTFAPKASMLVGGYHSLHKIFESQMATLNEFEAGIMVGSGFLANLSLFEALVRKGDHLLVDEEYHASGMMAIGLLKDRVTLFKHNDIEDLRSKISSVKAKRVIIAIEGVYSMSGELCAKEIFDICDENDALLIVDEAHSSGVIGKKLLGIFEHYGITPRANHIKMGTLGKAYGSYGAYILASQTIISFLENRAKPIIYSTAPSVIDTALAIVNMRYIQDNFEVLSREILQRQQICKEYLGFDLKSLIVALPQESNKIVLDMQTALMQEGFLVGAIRQPTVKVPILRIIPRLGVSEEYLRLLFDKLKMISIKFF